MTRSRVGNAGRRRAEKVTELRVAGFVADDNGGACRAKTDAEKKDTGDKRHEDEISSVSIEECGNFFLWCCVNFRTCPPQHGRVRVVAGLLGQRDRGQNDLVAFLFKG